MLDENPRCFERRVAVFFGSVVCFVAALDCVRAVRLSLLIDTDRDWAVARLVLGLAVISVVAALGGLGAASAYAVGRFCRTGSRALPELAMGSASRIVLFGAVVLLGTGIRFARLDRDPSALWIDNLCMIPQTLALTGGLRDFHDAIRTDPSNDRGNVGVLYLEVFRSVLQRFGTTVFAVRFLSALAGALSLLTAAFLARSLLPSGGATLAALILAGLRWSLILSRWGWVAVAVAPLADLAAILLLFARRRGNGWAAVAAGLVGGLGAHVYLSAWIAAFALSILAFWPIRDCGRRRLAVGFLFLFGFLCAVAPLFLLRQGRRSGYFGRAYPRNILVEAVAKRNPGVLVGIVGDSIAAPWLRADPVARHDETGRSRLGWILGLPVAAILIRSLFLPREALSGFLIAHSGAALAANVVGAHAGNPNGFRFAYLTTVAAVAAAGGILFLIGAVPHRHRSTAAIAAIGLLLIGSALSTRDLFRWADSRGTFASFWGVDTLVGRATLRWGDYGRVTVETALHPQTVELIRRYRLDPDAGERPAPSSTPHRAFRVASPGVRPSTGERVVERIHDGWGSAVGIVLARRV